MALHGHVGPTSALTAHERTPPRLGGARGLVLRLLDALEPPSIRGSAGPVKAAAALAAAGAFTLSWERFGNLSAGPYNVKLPVVLFGLALLLGAPVWARRVVATVRTRSLASAIVVLAATVVAYFVVRALFVSPISVGLAQIASVLTGAAGPAIVALGIVRTRDDARWLLAWVVRGAYFAGAFGLWQLFAFYTGLPQIVVYTGVGTSGVGGRIAAFSYEPAYFAYFIVLAVGAALTVARLDGRPLPWRSFAFFGLVLALANVRALVFLLPVVAVLLAVDWRRNRAVLLRGLIAAVPILLAVTFLPSATQAVVTSLQAQPEPTVQEPVRETPHGAKPERVQASPTPRALPTVARPVVEPPASVLDPSEQSSNAPRLAVYQATLAVDLRHPWVGVGPGGLRRALGGDDAPQQGGLVVANNVYLQAAADGGVPMLLLEVAVLVLMTLAWWRARGRAVQPLACSWLGVLAVGGMLTSYYFDVKVWVLGAVILTGAVLAEQHADAGASDASVSGA